MIQVGPGREFTGTFSQLLIKHNLKVRRGKVDTDQDQGIIERFNPILSERIFGHQYSQKFLLNARGSSEHSTKWVRALPEVVCTLNYEPTLLTGKKPSDAIRVKKVI